ncbi:hypothetical protein M409DRAFT_60845 [Zasmidium cellare ATCC 36951]|uniref:Uncharacterized protein n=1 Tax=Zasmidium cellare ATCC 36951 TaxID=1080233 RepID=A0A6A6BZD4_ZASCE|nr:uncharacterized protein M409DRAFT_60845 [Zasmidium cellare ATCC 36951]KAF2159378.1 hypothetical protein M409DRAFT_60845 [Zasmidium cellare ATCC 36951]
MVDSEPLPPNTLKVDFSWKKFRCLVTDPAPSATHNASMVVHCNLRKPHLEFRDSNDDELVGTGNLHTFKIDSESEVRGKPMHIKALKRFTTGYTHPSQVYRTPGGAPMTMTWTSSTDFKQWDFVCLDENSIPVARFSSNVWAVRKLGFIELMGEKAGDPAAREEITVVGLTIYYTMLLRMNNIFQLFGAVAAKPGYPKNENADEYEMYTPEAVSSGRDGDLDAKTAHARVTTAGSSSSSGMKPLEG